MSNNVNKVVDRNGNVLIDLTNDTVSASKVLSGTKFHGADGKEYIGTLAENKLDILKYTFIDYDGTVLYTYSDEEIDALTSLPTAPNHTDENLTFQEWNWTLDELKNWNRNRQSRPIVGANYITTDGKSYLYLDTPLTNNALTIEVYNENPTIDWGDGTIDTNASGYSVSHTYATPGKYTIILDISTKFKPTGNNARYIRKIKVGNIGDITNVAYGCTQLETINIPSGIVDFSGTIVADCKNLKACVMPKSITNSRKIQALFSYCFQLKILSFPASFNALEARNFQYCHSLKYITLPEGITTCGGDVFSTCTSLEYIDLPTTLTTIGSYMFSECHSLRTVIIPTSITVVRDYAFYNCYSLGSMRLPNSIVEIQSSAFYNCKYLSYLNIPDGVTSLGGILSSTVVTLDLTEQTKVLPLTTGIGLTSNGSEILINAELLEQYKTASYWSNFASIMVGK